MKRNASVLVIFLTVFIDLIGFGIVLPMLSLYCKEYGASGLLAGCIVASYSLMQFIFAPIWGRLSDRIGRRPILLISTAGACVSYIVFAFACGAQSIWLLLASRIAAGICGANLSVASAYIADISPPEIRSKRMGLIGMAFGLGFIFGPVLGALSAGWFGATGPGWTAAAICGLNLILAYFILGESRKPESDPAPPSPRIQQVTRMLRRPQLGYLIGVFFLATFCFTCFESTFALMFAGTKGQPGNFSYTKPLSIDSGNDTLIPIDWIVKSGSDVRKGDKLADYGNAQNRKILKAPASGRATLRDKASVISASVNLGSINTTKNAAYWLMAFCGIIGAIIQGGCIGPLVNWLGEKWLIVLGLAFVGISLALLPFCTEERGLMFLMGCLALFAMSSSVYRAPTFGLISLNASSAEQGEVMGVTQSVGSLARIIGPILALSLMDLHLELPYLICAFIAIIASILAVLLIVSPSKESMMQAEPVSVSSKDNELSAKTPVRMNLRGAGDKSTEPDAKGPARINLRTSEAPEEDDPVSP
jgi:DHA1 family tetracycline resistance protein-like MFS transporter